MISFPEKEVTMGVEVNGTEDDWNCLALSISVRFGFNIEIDAYLSLRAGPSSRRKVFVKKIVCVEFMNLRH